MKKIFFTAYLLALLLPLSAQLKVASGGKVGVGIPAGTPIFANAVMTLDNRVNRKIALQLTSNGVNQSRSTSFLLFNKDGSNQMYGMEIDQEQTQNSHQSSIYGIHVKSLNNGVGPTFGLYARVIANNPNNTNTNYAGFFNGNVCITGNLTCTSDERLKTGIREIIDARSLVRQLAPQILFF